jgi:hypothetical protein
VGFSLRLPTLLTTFAVDLYLLTTLSTDGSPKGQDQKLWYVNIASTPASTRTSASLTWRFQLVDQESNKTVAQSHSRIQSSLFKKPRDMSLEILEPISHAVDTVLLTFILVWRERHNERSKDLGKFTPLPIVLNDETI